MLCYTNEIGKEYDRDVKKKITGVIRPTNDIPMPLNTNEQEAHHQVGLGETRAV